jgi:hypothetical protein
MKLDLRDVTVCAVDTVNVALAARSLHLSMAQCHFADAVLFSHAPVAGAFRTVEIGKLNSIAEYSNFVFKHLSTRIKTPYVLLVQWDGYVIDPAAWSPTFREYDYIGARWPGEADGMSVGNGGFSLRSRKFLSAVTEPRFAVDKDMNEDWLICRAYRPVLEGEYGIRFAPESVADMFSYENTQPNKPSFGFHGMGNMWRHLKDAEAVKLVDLVAPYVCRTPQYVKLLISYFVFNNIDPLRALYSKLKAHVASDDVLPLIKSVACNDDLALQCVNVCEGLLLPACSDI